MVMIAKHWKGWPYSSALHVLSMFDREGKEIQDEQIQKKFENALRHLFN
jgi:hypothetical protein